MTKLEYTFKNDTLFKMVFVKYQNLLKRLVAELVGIRLESIKNFAIANPEMPPDVIGDKFCRLDINMTVDGQRVDLEIQVADEGDYPERSLYYWAREYSTALGEGEDYSDLPRTIVISIVAFSEERQRDISFYRMNEAREKMLKNSKSIEATQNSLFMDDAVKAKNLEKYREEQDKLLNEYNKEAEYHNYRFR